MAHSWRKLLLGDFTLKRFIRSFLFIYTCFAVYVYIFSDSMIFLPPESSYEDSPEILKLLTPDQEYISALHLPHRDATYTLLYIHGNAEDLGDIRPLLDQLHTLNVNIFAYDYRGYGTSEGRPSERNAYVDVKTAYQYLRDTLNVPAENIIVFGRSVGGGSALYLAVHKPVGGIILESTFTQAFRVVVPFPLLPFDKFRNLDRIKRVSAPVLIIHGTADETIPIAHGKKLFEAAPEPKLAFWVEGATHNDVPWVDWDAYQNKLQKFVDLLESERNSLYLETGLSQSSR
ncbi:alpha/beta hydrolase [Spirulina subsalsa]|uniref:alpha/beta hydrolase n=1 Tax=Spirulina subsalsa TaxID=54311 RepID=UPI000360501D|nr:alpha/beta hydrolase [Spirulina subsalsa]